MSSAGPSQPRALLQHPFEKLSDDPDNPPRNYIFVPKGDVYLTRHCRNLTSVSGRKLWIVYDRKTNERLGIHCFQQIVEAVKEDAAATEEKRQRAVAAKDSREHKRAREMLLSLFPKIPDSSCTEILEHGFQKGSGRVGRSTVLEENLKVQLAVNAHIRHRLTRYDFILAAGQITKVAAREMVYGHVQEIADSWRAMNFQAWNSKSRTSKPKGSAATLATNRQRRSQQRKSQTTPSEEAEILEEALGGLRLDETMSTVHKIVRQERSHEDSLGGVARTKAQMKAARRQQHAQKATSKEGHKGRYGEAVRDLLSRYEVDPNIEMSKREKNSVLHLQREQERKLGKKKYWKIVHQRQESAKLAENRRLIITGNGVGLEPKDTHRYVPDHAPSDDQPRMPRLERSSHRTPSETATNSDDLVTDIHGEGMQLKSGRLDRYVPDDDPSDDDPRGPRLLRSSYRTPSGTATNNDDIVNDMRREGVQPGPRGHDRYVPIYGPSPSIDRPRTSPHPSRCKNGETGDIPINTNDGRGSIEECTSDGRLLVEDSEWMDIDDISMKTARVHLA